MSCHPRVTEWTPIIQTHLPHLSKPQATVLALWSLGMVRARSCARTAVRAFLATWLGRKEPAVRQQWRACCYEARNERSCHQRQSSWNSFVLNDFYASFTEGLTK
jgi:hypothetical protein